MQQEEYVFKIADEHRERMDEDFVIKFANKQPQWGPLGLVTFKRTYARRLTDAQRDFRSRNGIRHKDSSTEEFWEALRRVTEGTFSILRQQVRIGRQRWSEKEAQQKMRQMFKLMWEGKFLPPGRGLGMMGADVIEKKGAACANNCGFTGTENIDQDFATPFLMLMDYSMLGVGMGFDTKGAGKIRLSMPETSNDAHQIPDTREGWCAALGRVLNAFIGEGSLPDSWDVSLIRPEGAVIHTFGGTASGPKPLLELLHGTTDLLMTGVGRPITSTMIVDVMNMIGRCVVAGNVRRSAEIALGDPKDDAFLALKDPSTLIELSTHQSKIARRNPEWLLLQGKIDEKESTIRGVSMLNPDIQPTLREIADLRKEQNAVLRQDSGWVELDAMIQAHPLRKYRWASNNTIMCDVSEDYTEFARQTATNGEPGYFWLDVVRAYGRLSDPPNNADARAIGTNPCSEQSLWDAELCCVSRDTRITTRNGAPLIGDVVGKPVEVWNGDGWSTVIPFKAASGKKLFRVTLSDGSYLDCTEDHAWSVNKTKGAILRRLETKDLEPGMRVASFELSQPTMGVLEPNAFAYGVFLGDGHMDGDKIRLSLYGDKIDLLGRGLPGRLQSVIRPEGYNVDRANVVLTDVLDVEKARSLKGTGRLPDWVFEMDAESTAEFVAGWIDADGALRAQANTDSFLVNGTEAQLRDLQILLRRIGINHASVYCTGKEGDVTNFGTRTQDLWSCYVPSYESHLIPTRLKVGTRFGGRYRTNNAHALSAPIDTARKQNTVSIEELPGLHDTYCFSEPVNHMGVFGNVLTYQCLVETFPTRHASLEEYLLTLKYAYLYAKVVTLIPTHNQQTNSVIARNRRIGTSMAGIWEMYETLGLRECIRWWREGYDYIRQLDEEYSGWMGVSRSIKVTSVKPGGTIPLLLGIEGGMKLPISRFYMRTIRIEEGSSLSRAVEAAGYRVEPDLTTPRTVVAYFPCKEEKAKRVARDVPLWEQAALFTQLQHDWSDNQVSATLTFKPEEAGELDKVLSVYSGKWKSVSFLPLWDHQFPQAPYIPCSEDEYKSALSKIKPLVLEEDVHDSEDKFCSNGLCERPVV